MGNGKEKPLIYIIWNNRYHKMVGAYLNQEKAEKRLHELKESVKEKLYNKFKILAQAEFDAAITYSIRPVTIEDG